MEVSGPSIRYLLLFIRCLYVYLGREIPIRKSIAIRVLSKERRFVLFPFLGMKKTFKFAKADGFGQILLRVSA
jgi:hypothetical protein|tara:strand:- start:328 stop:546 length:219 start_codon:yes stop_codon:yes gene_type:complete